VSTSRLASVLVFQEISVFFLFFWIFYFHSKHAIAFKIS
jgi:hypothetical protein